MPASTARADRRLELGAGDRDDEPVGPGGDRLLDQLAHRADVVDVRRAVGELDAHLPPRGLDPVAHDRPERARRLPVRDDPDAAPRLAAAGHGRLVGRRRLAHDDVGLAGLARAAAARQQRECQQAGGEPRHAGITARSVVPRPGRAVDRQPAVERREPVLQAAQPGAALDVGAADAVVGDDHHDALAGAADLHARLVRPRVAGDVGQRLGDHEVGGGLDLRRRALVELDVDLDGQRHAVGEPLHGGPEPAVGEDRGVDAARELAQLGERDRELVARSPRPSGRRRCPSAARAAGAGRARARRAAAGRRRGGRARAAGGRRRRPRRCARGRSAGPPRGRAGRPSGARCRARAPRRPRRR